MLTSSLIIAGIGSVDLIVRHHVLLHSLCFRYELRPTPDINFGPVMFAVTKTYPFTIYNKGLFPFDYNIGQYNDSETLDWSKKIECVEIGSFTVVNPTGSVDVGSCVVIAVTCTPVNACHLEECAVVHISQSPPHLSNGTLVKLIADGCLPAVDFDDYETMFHEHYIASKLSKFQPPAKVQYIYSPTYTSHNISISYIPLVFVFQLTDWLLLCLHYRRQSVKFY